MPQTPSTTVKIATARGAAPNFPAARQATTLSTRPSVTGIAALRPLKTGGTATSPTIALESPLPIAHGGTGTSTPSLQAGSGIDISGTWPNQTVAVKGGGGGGAGVTSLDNMTGAVRMTATSPVAITDGAPGQPTAGQINVSIPVPATLDGSTASSSILTIDGANGTQYVFSNAGLFSQPELDLIDTALVTQGTFSSAGYLIDTTVSHGASNPGGSTAFLGVTDTAQMSTSGYPLHQFVIAEYHKGSGGTIDLVTGTYVVYNNGAASSSYGTDAVVQGVATVEGTGATGDVFTVDGVSSSSFKFTNALPEFGSPGALLENAGLIISGPATTSAVLIDSSGTGGGQGVLVVSDTTSFPNYGLGKFLIIDPSTGSGAAVDLVNGALEAYGAGRTPKGVLPPTCTAAGAFVATTLHQIVDQFTASGVSTSVTFAGVAAFSNANYTLIVQDQNTFALATPTAKSTTGFTVPTVAGHVYSIFASGT
jgi:hypothetical protein